MRMMMRVRRDMEDFEASLKDVRLTLEQVEVLEMAFSESSRPFCSCRKQLIKDFPVLADADPHHINLWFKYRRGHASKEAALRSAITETITVINGISTEEQSGGRHRIKMKNFLETQGESCMDLVDDRKHKRALRRPDNDDGLITIAEETLAIFLEKAKGTAVDWVPIPGMKPGPDSAGIVSSISQNCSGVAAKSIGRVKLDASTIAESLKDRASWFQDCRSTNIFKIINTENGGIIELIDTQTYAPTMLARARDFRTLRYTTTLENGSLVVCERSVPGSWGGPDAGMPQQFVRTELLPSGYLIKPYKGKRSSICIVDHIDFEAPDVPEAQRPRYESAEVVAQRMTIAALRYVKQLAIEATFDAASEPSLGPAVMRTYIQKLSRGFNDAINGFSDDGWSQLGGDATDDVIVTVKSTDAGTSSGSHQPLGSILCAKTHMVLKNLSPAVVVRFLRKHRSEWADYYVDSYCANSLKASSDPIPEMRPTRFSGNQIVIPMMNTIDNEQALEVIRLKSLSPGQGNDAHLLQMCSGMDENSVGAYSELIFASTDNVLSDDCFLLSSGFRMIPLSANTIEDDVQNSLIHWTPIPSPSHRCPHTEGQNEGNATSPYARRTILTMAFQFPIGRNRLDDVASMARQYVRNVVSSVEEIAIAITPYGFLADFLSSPYFSYPEDHTLAQWTWQSYCSQVGGELLRDDRFDGGSILKSLWHHKDAIICCSLDAQPRLLLINQAGVSMVESRLGIVQRDITVDKILSERTMRTLISEFPQIIHQGFSILPGGTHPSTRGRLASYNNIIAWKVLAEDDTTHCVAVSFVNWSFI